MATKPQAVRQKGVEPEWEGPGVTTRDKGLVYVLDNFDCPDFKLLSGKCRCVIRCVPGIQHVYASDSLVSPNLTKHITAIKCIMRDVYVVKFAMYMWVMDVG